MGGEGSDRNSQAELQLSRAAFCWLFGEMQAEVDFLCHCINQWPDSVSFVKGALSPRLPCYKGTLKQMGTSSLTVIDQAGTLPYLPSVRARVPNP